MQLAAALRSPAQENHTLFDSLREFKLSLSVSSPAPSPSPHLTHNLDPAQHSLPPPSPSSTNMTSALRTPWRSVSAIAPNGVAAAAAASPAAAATTTLQPPSVLNRTATNSTGIYQQSVLLRSRLHRLPAFGGFLEFSHSGRRASRDVVQQMWETFSLGKPLITLFNLLDIPEVSKISEYDDNIVDPDPLRKERQRAIALFIIGVNHLKNASIWEKDAPLFSISELVGDEMDTNGFVKVVATVLYLLDRLPPSVWSDEVVTSGPGVIVSSESCSSITSRADTERANLVRELIETERKYCQDLEVMQSYSEFLREQNIVDADTIHNLFPALTKLTGFQRKLLIQMEATAEHCLDEQDWGFCFSLHESEFAIYDAYIANYSNALDLAVAEQQTLMAASSVISAAQLPAFLIKPVQRLCRYPLLLGSLLKLTPEEHALHESLTQGVDAVKRIADAANRALREKENDETWQNILARIKDWKGLQLDNVDSLLLDDLFSVNGEKRPYSEYHVFLFNRMLLLCRPKETQPERDVAGDKEKEKDKKKDKRSQNLATPVAVVPPTPTMANPSAFFAAGAVASRRSKATLSIRGSLYLRNIVELTPNTSVPYSIQLRYRDRGEVISWTFNCRNEEQVNLWCNELKRLVEKKKVEARGESRSTKTSMHLDEKAPHASMESLDTMRSARRPAHPYSYTFESGGGTRARNGSMDLGSKPTSTKPSEENQNRARSSSVTSVASEAYDSRDNARAASADLSNLRSAASKSAVDLPLSPNSAREKGDASFESQIGWQSSLRASRRNAISHNRTESQTSEMSIGRSSVKAAEVPRPTSANAGGRLSGRLRSSPLPPQLPPPTGPQPPLPRAESQEQLFHSRQASFSIGEIKPLPTPPVNLRDRVGDRVPAPLAPACSTAPVVTGTVPTPQSTLPELPGRDARRPLSNRKSNTPLRGPRERGQAPLSAHGDSDTSFISRTRSRNNSVSNSYSEANDSRRVSSRDASVVNRGARARHRRQGSDTSGTTDSISILTSSEEPGQEVSPLTPNSFVDENGKGSPATQTFGPQITSPLRPQESRAMTSSGLTPRSRTVSTNASTIDPQEAPPDYYAGVTPKVSEHSRRGLNSSTSSMSEREEDHSKLLPSRRGEDRTQSRSPSTSGLGRTASGESSGMITVRLHHNNSRFTLKMSHSTSRREFVDKIRHKIRLCGAVLHSIPQDQLDPSRFSSEEQVSYLSDTNQFVNLNTDYDFAKAWKSTSCRRMNPADSNVLILAVGSTNHLAYDNTI